MLACASIQLFNKLEFDFGRSCHKIGVFMKYFISIILLILVVCASANSSITVPYLSNTPVIDGVINDNEWQGATGLTGMRLLNNSQMSPEQTILYIGYDEKKLYLAYKCYSENEPIGAKRERGGPYWQDDAIELFVRPSVGVLGTYQIVTNYTGGFTDLAHNNADAKPLDIVSSGSISSGYKKIGAKKEDMYWQGEMSITWASLGVKSPDENTEMSFFFARDHVAGGKYLSSFCDIKSSFIGEIDKYAKITFAKNIPSVKMVYTNVLGSKNIFYNPTNEDAKLNINYKMDGKDSFSEVVTVPASSQLNYDSKTNFPKGEYFLDTNITLDKSKAVLLDNSVKVFNVEPIVINYDKKNKKIVCDLDFNGLNFMSRPTAELTIRQRERFFVGYMMSPDIKHTEKRLEIDVSNLPKGNYNLDFMIFGLFTKSDIINIE